MNEADWSLDYFAGAIDGLRKEAARLVGCAVEVSSLAHGLTIRAEQLEALLARAKRLEEKR